METIFWLIALGVFLLIEIVTLGLTTIWFAGGALVAFLAAVIHLPLWVQVVVFFAVSIILLFFTRPLATKWFNSKRTKTNYESLIGTEVKVTERIDNFNQTGTVNAGGQEWTARTVEDDTILEVGERVSVVGVSGVKLIVTKQ